MGAQQAIVSAFNGAPQYELPKSEKADGPPSAFRASRLTPQGGDVFSGKSLASCYVGGAMKALRFFM